MARGRYTARWGGGPAIGSRPRILVSPRRVRLGRTLRWTRAGAELESTLATTPFAGRFQGGGSEVRAGCVDRRGRLAALRGRLRGEGNALRSGLLRDVEDVHGLTEQHRLVAAQDHHLLG
jgi:hypothetical protein